MTYNGLGLQSYGRRARRAHFLLGWAYPSALHGR